MPAPSTVVTAGSRPLTAGKDQHTSGKSTGWNAHRSFVVRFRGRRKIRYKPSGGQIGARLRSALSDVDVSGDSQVDPPDAGSTPDTTSLSGDRLWVNAVIHQPIKYTKAF